MVCVNDSYSLSIDFGEKTTIFKREKRNVEDEVKRKIIINLVDRRSRESCAPDSTTNISY